MVVAHPNISRNDSFPGITGGGREKGERGGGEGRHGGEVLVSNLQVWTILAGEQSALNAMEKSSSVPHVYTHIPLSFVFDLSLC